MLIRRTLRIVLRMALVAGVVGLVRALLGRLAGEPGVGADPASAPPPVPMSLDRWPSVPQAAGRSGG